MDCIKKRTTYWVFWGLTVFLAKKEESGQTNVSK